MRKLKDDIFCCCFWWSGCFLVVSSGGIFMYTGNWENKRKFVRKIEKIKLRKEKNLSWFKFLRFCGEFGEYLEIETCYHQWVGDQTFNMQTEEL